MPPHFTKTPFIPSHNIPEDIIEKILLLLPFKKLCTLSILSKRFQHTWKSCRNLCFDADFSRNLSREACRGIIDGFFSGNSSTCADRFRLRYDATDDNGVVSFWVGKAVNLGIFELELDLITQTDDKVTLDYDLVDVDTLRVLRLVNCELHLPVSSNGLRHLREITLEKVMAPPKLTESVFSNCVLLKSVRPIGCSLMYNIKVFGGELRDLVLKNCSDLYYVEVNCVGLRRFHYHGKMMMELKFGGDMKFLSDVVLEIAHPRGFQRLSRAEEITRRLAFMEVLSVTTVFLEGLCAKFENNAYKKIEFSLKKLREFHLVVAPESFLNPSDVAIFIKKCPVIEKIFIDVGRDAFGRSLYWDNYGKNYLSCCETTFPFLKYVKIKGFAMRELLIYMARFFLKNAIHLHFLILVKARIHNFPLDYNPENLRWGILSNAKIEMYNYRADNNAEMPHHLRNV